MPETLARMPLPIATEGVGRSIAAWASGLRYEDLPNPVVRRAKQLLLDTLAVGWAGSGAEGIAALHALAVRQGGAADSRIWTFGGSLPAPQAAFLNGAMAAALDFDSVHDEATVHADIVVAPAVLAIAEQNALSGREFLAAYVAGDEILVRLGLAIRTHPGWFYTSALGVFAAAAASARALGLGVGGTLSSMGIALSRAAGTQQALVERATTKRLQSAFAARDGVDAALLAQCGVSAPVDLFEGQCGFESLYTKLDHRTLTEGLGRDYRFASLTLKKHASCFCNHAAIEAALDLVTRHKLTAAEVSEASVRISPFMARLVGAEFSPGDNPQVCAQFSVQYSIASVLARGRFAVSDIQPAAVMDERVGALARRIKVIVDPAQTGKFVPATVVVKTNQGVQFESTATKLPGTPDHPMTDTEHQAKVISCLTSGAQPMTQTQAARFIEKVDRIESLTSMRDFWNLE